MAFDLLSFFDLLSQGAFKQGLERGIRVTRRIARDRGRRAVTGDSMLITVTRTQKSIDGIFGNLQIDIEPFKCVTLENLKLAIPVGVYDVYFMWSDHFQQIMPHIIVPAIPSANLPKRIAIEVHWANYPVQLEGCPALGTEEDFKDDMITQSKAAWIEFAKAITDQPSIKFRVQEDYGPLAVG